MIDGLIAGRLHGAAESRVDRHKQPFVVARVKASGGEGESVFVNVIAFEAPVCEQLLVLGDGDAVALSGSLTPRVWTDKQGKHRPALDMVAHQVLTAYHLGQRRAATRGRDDAEPLGHLDD